MEVLGDNPGTFSQRLEHLDEASRSYERIGLDLFRSLVEMQRAHGLLRAGRVAEASAVLETALQRARSRRELELEAHGLHPWANSRWRPNCLTRTAR